MKKLLNNIVCILLLIVVGVLSFGVFAVCANSASAFLNLVGVCGGLKLALVIAAMISVILDMTCYVEINLLAVVTRYKGFENWKSATRVDYIKAPFSVIGKIRNTMQS